MLEILAETLIDNIKIFPFLFVTYLFLEYLERKTSDKTTAAIQKTTKAGPFIGAVLGVLPQCGFSVVAANLFAARVITMGTLIAIFLSTSDELLPILVSYEAPLSLIALIIGYKAVCGVVFGYLIDFLINRHKPLPLPDIETLCQNEHCHCEDSEPIWKPALYHSVRITLFILIVSLILNLLLQYSGNSTDFTQILQYPLLGEMLSALIGLIPNCSASVILTQMYILNYIDFSTMISGSLVSGGVGLLVLFRVNRPLKQNLKIIVLLYVCGLLGGLCSNLLEF